LISAHQNYWKTPKNINLKKKHEIPKTLLKHKNKQPQTKKLYDVKNASYSKKNK
jgi:hypothetical protein